MPIFDVALELRQNGGGAPKSHLFTLRLRSAVSQVSTLAQQILEKDLSDRRKTSEVDLGPLVGGSYGSLVEAELARKLRRLRALPSRTVPVAKLFDADCAADFRGWDFAAAATRS